MWLILNEFQWFKAVTLMYCEVYNDYRGKIYDNISMECGE